ncbi:MAG: hypothetical protein V1778_03060 [bacterium]
MFADIHPLLRLPRSLGPFTYRLPKESAHPNDLIGQWVKIPFRRSLTNGILWSLRASPPPGVNSITEVTSFLDAPRVTAEQRKLVDYFSERYYLSHAAALRTLLPLPTRMPTQQTPVPAYRERLTLPRQHIQLLRALARRLALHAEGNVFLPLASLAERVTLLLLYLQGVPPKTQTSILVPTHQEGLRLWSALSRHFPGRVRFLSSALSASSFWSQWTDAARQTNGIFICTRKGLCPPFCSLGRIIVDLASDPSYKNADQNPRFQTKTLAAEMAGLYKVPIVYMDAQPTLALWSRPEMVIERTVSPLPQKRRASELPPTGMKTTTVRFSLEAEAMLEHARSAPCLLFCNRRGYARRILCRECGWVLRCPRCNIPVSEHLARVPHCHHCGASVVLPKRCPMCGGVRLMGRGVGTEKVAEELSQRYPSRRVVTVDKEHATVPTLRPDDLVVATEKILQTPFLPTFGSCIIMNIDDLLQYPDFGTVERAYLLLERLCSLVRPSGTVVFQTENHGQPILTSLVQRTPEAVYTDESRIRSLLSLPPLSSTTLLLGNAPSSAEVDVAAAAVGRTLQLLEASRYRIVGPLIPFPERIGRRYRRIFLIHSLSKNARAATLGDILSRLPAHWLIDIEPESFSLS